MSQTMNLVKFCIMAIMFIGHVCCPSLAIAQDLSAQNYLILDEAHESMTARLASIDSAKKEINLCSFIIAQDEAGIHLLNRLAKAAARGVEVKIIVDAYYNEIEKSTIKVLESMGLQIKLYAPFDLLKPNRWWKRMHNKFLVIDDEIMITGGRNIKNDYFDMNEKKNYLDRDILFKSKSLNAIASNYFDSLWNSDFVKNIKKKKFKISDIEESKHIIEHSKYIAKTIDAEFEEKVQSFLRESSELGDTEFIHDPLSKDNNDGTGEKLLQLMAKAQEEIIIETPYFVLTKRTFNILKDAALRGVKIKIMTNSMASNDVQLSHASYLRYRNKLLKLGIEIYELLSDNYKLHAKSYLIDREYSIIGSFNFNGRSLHQDFEILTVSNNDELAAELLESFEFHLENFHKVNTDGTLGEYDVKFPKTTFLKRVALSFKKIFLSPILTLQI